METKLEGPGILPGRETRKLRAYQKRNTQACTHIPHMHAYMYTHKSMCGKTIHHIYTGTGARAQICLHMHVYVQTCPCTSAYCMHALTLVCACSRICRLLTQRSLLHSGKVLPGNAVSRWAGVTLRGPRCPGTSGALGAQNCLNKSPFTDPHQPSNWAALVGLVWEQ